MAHIPVPVSLVGAFTAWERTSSNVEHVSKGYLVNWGKRQFAFEQQHKDGMLAIYDKVSTSITKCWNWRQLCT
jgi:hypothetical protein